MASVTIKEAFELETRNKYTKVDCEVMIKVDGKELPTAATLGASLESIVELLQEKVTESFKVVPPRAVPPTTATTVTTPTTSPTGY